MTERFTFIFFSRTKEEVIFSQHQNPRFQNLFIGISEKITDYT